MSSRIVDSKSASLDMVRQRIEEEQRYRRVQRRGADRGLDRSAQERNGSIRRPPQGSSSEQKPTVTTVRSNIGALADTEA